MSVPIRSTQPNTTAPILRCHETRSPLLSLTITSTGPIGGPIPSSAGDEVGRKRPLLEVQQDSQSRFGQSLLSHHSTHQFAAGAPGRPIGFLRTRTANFLGRRTLYRSDVTDYGSSLKRPES